MVSKKSFSECSCWSLDFVLFYFYFFCKWSFLVIFYSLSLSFCIIMMSHISSAVLKLWRYSSFPLRNSQRATTRAGNIELLEFLFVMSYFAHTFWHWTSIMWLTCFCETLKQLPSLWKIHKLPLICSSTFLCETCWSLLQVVYFIFDYINQLF